jgi:hypothetical protein
MKMQRGPFAAVQASSSRCVPATLTGDLARIALGRDLGREVQDDLRRDGIDTALERLGVTEVACDRGGPRRLRAGTAHERGDVVAASEQLRAHGVADEAARAGDESLHAAIVAAHEHPGRAVRAVLARRHGGASL